jgi:hypothetical protein
MDGSGDAIGDGVGATSGIGPVEPTDCTGWAEDTGAAGVGVGVGGGKMGRTPVGPTKPPSTDETKLPAEEGDGVGCRITGGRSAEGVTAADEGGTTISGAAELGTTAELDAGKGEELGRTMPNGKSTLGLTRGSLEGAACGVSPGALRLGVGAEEGVTITFGIGAVEPTSELAGGGEGGSALTPLDWEDDTRWFPGTGAGTGVTTISSTEVTVLVASGSLLLTTKFDDGSGRGLKKEFVRVVMSGNCRDSGCSEELRGVNVEDVATAGAVVLVTIWRLTCRGK